MDMQQPPTITVAFSHKSSPTQALVLKAAGSATQSLQVAAYQLTDPAVVQAMMDAHKRGVKVSVYVDRTQQANEAVTALVKTGVECRVDKAHRILHHKFMIVDGRHVQTGSYNYSRNAYKVNAENVLYIQNSPVLAKAYLEEFSRLVTGKNVPCEEGK
jgi:phosphatidylserine/phosphatidylglycerophosphate/cardiolipin synthase-like enzyme